MPVMGFVVTLAGLGDAVDRRRRLGDLAAVLARHGVGNLLVDWMADGAPGWPAFVMGEPLRVAGSASYSATLDAALSAAQVGPDATVSVEWNPDPAGDPQRDRAVYRLAAAIPSLPGVAGRVVLAANDPARYRERYPDTDDWLPVPLQAFYAALGEAGGLVGVDWRSTREEAATALDGLQVLPQAQQRLGAVAPDFPELLRRCELGDQADLGAGPGLLGDDPLRAEGEQAEPIVAREAARLAARASTVLLRLDNGDTPGYLAADAEWAREFLGLSADAGLSLGPVEIA